MLKAIFKTKFLAYLGLVIAISLVGFLLLSFLLIPEFKGIAPVSQIYTIQGEALRYDDSGITGDFFQSIRRNNGYLLLGTSESGEMEGGNYYDYLNNDQQIAARFSKLSGAGRTCGIYLPVFLRHGTELKGLKVIYLINPVYWGTNLCKPEFDYWTRYVDYGLAMNTLHDHRAPVLVQEVLKQYNSTLNLPNQVLYTLVSVVRKAHAKFKRDLNFLINPSDYASSLQPITPKNDSLDYQNFGRIDTMAIDTLWNVNKVFLSHKRMSAINEEVDFRYQELEAFIGLGKQLEMEITFLMCPANEIFIKRFEPAALTGYQNTNARIKELLLSYSADVVDATQIGREAGTFIDNQHISSYGAYLIYQKIKSHLHEKETMETK